MSIITAVGIDVSKGKSMVAAMRPAGEVVLDPFGGFAHIENKTLTLYVPPFNFLKSCHLSR